MRMLHLLDSCSIIDRYEVIDFREWGSGVYYKIFAYLINNTELHIREYIDENERKYSYHWQNNNGELIIRWDNAPYHDKINTYPHHKHIKQKIKASKQIALDDIISFIENKINNQ